MNRKGLTLIELLAAMLVLSVGVLGLAAGTGWMIRSADLAQTETGRAAALQAGVESVHGSAFAAVTDGSTSEGAFEVSWTVAEESPNWKLLEFVVVGPGRVPGSTGASGVISNTVADTLEYRIIRP